MTGMMISYDNDAKAMYIALKAETKVSRTVEFSSDTFLDIAKNGELIGVEMLKPNHSELRRIAKKYHHPELSRIQPEKFLKAVA